LQLSGITYESLVDGPGIRVVVFAQGCEMSCGNCHNPESWDKTSGRKYTAQEVIRLVKKPGPGKRRVRGITFSGGEPFLQAADFAKVAIDAKHQGWDVTTYTGFTYEDLAAQNNPGIQELLTHTDYLIDGRYIHELRDINLKFRGSTNQRIIDMNKTREEGVTVTIPDDVEL